MPFLVREKDATGQLVPRGVYPGNDPNQARLDLAEYHRDRYQRDRFDLQPLDPHRAEAVREGLLRGR